MADDFSERVKTTLASRVGNLCSNPKCRALTSGPQIDPTKALNVGVAAHITAASPGGPRYDPSLSPEQRSGHENGIWLCQTDAKLVDNDAIRFPADQLKKWKSDAEQEAFDRIGRTAVRDGRPQLTFTPGTRLRIEAIIPRRIEQDVWIVMQDDSEFVQVQKGNTAQILIPKSLIEAFHNLGNAVPSLVQLKGRLQWITPEQMLKLFTEKPPIGPEGDYGIWKSVGIYDPQIADLEHRFKCRWMPLATLALCLSSGWHIFYDIDGRYIRWDTRLMMCPNP
jgi:hypothetical protein